MASSSKLLQTTLWIDVVVCSLVGLILFISPTIMFTDPFASNMMGGVFFTFVILNLLALRETEIDAINGAVANYGRQVAQSLWEATLGRWVAQIGIVAKPEEEIFTR